MHLSCLNVAPRWRAFRAENRVIAVGECPTEARGTLSLTSFRPSTQLTKRLELGDDFEGRPSTRRKLPFNGIAMP